MKKIELINELDKMKEGLRTNKNHPNASLVKAYIKGSERAMRDGLMTIAEQNMATAYIFYNRTDKKATVSKSSAAWVASFN